MINFILGRAGAGKSEYVLEKIKAMLAGGRRVYLIVPDQQLVIWEKKAAQTLPPSAALSFDALSFSRLANLCARKYGGLSYNYIDDAGKALIMWRAVISVKDSLRVYGKTAVEDRYVMPLLSAVGEMKRCGISVHELDAASGDFGDEGLSDKIADLALIWAAYETLLHESYADRDDDITALDKQLSSHAFFADSVVFIDSFFTLTAAEQSILRHIFRQADEAYMTFCLPLHRTDELVFDNIRSYMKKTFRDAELVSSTPEITELFAARHHDKTMLEWLEENLFGCDNDISCDINDDSVRVIYTGDRYEEAKACCAVIHELVMSGARYSDIAVVARDMEALRGIIDMELAEQGIPFFFSQRKNLACHSAVRLVISLLSAVSAGFYSRDVIACVKTGLCGLSLDDCSAFEKYCETWRLRGRRTFCSGNLWTMNPDGYTEELSEASRETLDCVNRVRERLSLPFEAFACVFDGELPTAAQICAAILEFLRDFRVYEQLCEQSERLYERGERAEAVISSQLWDFIKGALFTMSDILADTPLDASVFLRLFIRVIENLDISAIPSSCDEVTLGSANTLRTDKLQHMIILGVCDGEFPKTPEHGGIFSEHDRKRLEECGIALSGNSELAVCDELFWFYRTIASPAQSLCLISPRSDAGKLKKESPVLSRLIRIAPGTKRSDFSELSLTDRIYTPKNAEDAVLSMGDSPERDMLCGLYERFTGKPSEKLLFEPSLLSAKSERLSPITASRLFPDRLSFSQTRLERYVSCPFSYYCRHILKLEEPKSADIKSVDVGRFIHGVLEKYFDKTKAKALGEEESARLCDELCADYIKRLLGGGEPDGRLLHMFSRLRSSVYMFIRALEKEFAQSEFSPEFFEMPINRGSSSAILEFSPDGGKTIVTLSGVIDRVDTYRENKRTYVRVVDYKTGDKTFSLDDVTLGLNLQLLIYLFALWKCPPGELHDKIAPDGGEILPAGALYFSARFGAARADRLLSPDEAARLAAGKIERSGILLDDESILRKMEPALEGKFIPVSLRTDGTPKASAPLESLESFGKLYSRIADVICGIAGRIKSGEAGAVPLVHAGKSPCAYCAYKAVCRRHAFEA